LHWEGKPHSMTDELTAQICSCTRRKKSCMPRQGGCLARMSEEEEERSPGTWSPSSARYLVALIRRSRVEEVQHGGVAQRRRRSRLHKSPAPNRAHRPVDSLQAPRRPLASSSVVFCLNARVKPPVDPCEA
jgi:hypothetical protein